MPLQTPKPKAIPIRIKIFGIVMKDTVNIDRSPQNLPTLLFRRIHQTPLSVSEGTNGPRPVH
jgi:hypothetical protein